MSNRDLVKISQILNCHNYHQIAVEYLNLSSVEAKNIYQSSYNYQDAFLNCLLKWKMKNPHQNSKIDLIRILNDMTFKGVILNPETFNFLNKG